MPASSFHFRYGPFCRPMLKKMYSKGSFHKAVCLVFHWVGYFGHAQAKYSLLAQYHNTPLLPQKICIGIVLDFPWDIFMSQEKLQTMIMQNCNLWVYFEQEFKQNNTSFVLSLDQRSSEGRIGPPL